METIKKYAKLTLGSLLIAVALNVFYKSRGILPAGIFGFVTLVDYAFEIDLWLILAITNIIFLLIGDVVLSKKKIKRAIFPFLMIPLLCYFTKDLGVVAGLQDVDMLLLTIYGSIIMGLGYHLIYKEHYYASSTDIISQIEKIFTGMKSNVMNYFIDAALVGLSVCLFGLENAMYTVISIIVIEILSKRAALGTSDSKVFYIITQNFKEVRDYIIEEMHYTLTAFDVKGGFLKKKNTIIMSVIPTKDYYKLREGIKTIDPSAFISITDSYEVINKDKEK